MTTVPSGSLRRRHRRGGPRALARWLEWDYPALVPRHAGALRSLRAIYVDCGRRDEWYLDLTAGGCAAV